MDEQEILRRQEEGFRLAKELGPVAFANHKRERQAKRWQEWKNKKIAEKAAELIASPEQVAAVLERPKKRGCFVQIMVVDEGGEYTAIWEAPALMGTVMPGKRGRGYIDMAKPLLQQIYGKLVDKQT